MKALLTGLLLLAAAGAFAQTEESLTVYFPFNRYYITPDAARQLDSLRESVKENTGGPAFSLWGHCDNRGTDEYNNRLSQKRAKAVMEYLVRKGMNREAFLSVNGAGETAPLNENKTESERQLNRRVVIRITMPDHTGVMKKEDRTPLKEKIADTSITAGTRIILRNINFLGGLHEFLPESYPMLEELLEAMQGNPRLIIRVEGHICCQEGPGDGMDNGTGIENLSEARAMAVRDYLLEKGIAAARVSYQGFGHSRPLHPYPENTEEERVQNRRVEIKILRK